MYNLPKFMESSFNDHKFLRNLEIKLEHLKNNLMEEQGRETVQILVPNTWDNLWYAFIRLLDCIPSEEIENAEENETVEDLCYDYMGKLAEDLGTLCSEYDINLGDYALDVSSSEWDGSINIMVYHKHFEDIVQKSDRLVSPKYKLEKYFNEVVNDDEFINALDRSYTELENNMISYDGKVVVAELVLGDYTSTPSKDFLQLIKVDEKEIVKAEEEGYLEDLAVEYFGILGQDLHQLCAEKSYIFGCYDFYIGHNEGDISVIGYYENWDEISHLSEDEYQLRLAISKEFECDVTDVIDIDEDGLYQVEGIEYLICNEDEATDKCLEYIKDTIWAFNPSFLAECTDLPVEMFQAVIDNGKCESNNDALLMVVDKLCGVEDFAEKAIDADGRGSFLSSYDGEEIEIDVQGETYYAYRQ